MARFSAAVQARDFETLAALFTPHCLRSCRGFAPLPFKEGGRSRVGFWITRPVHGTFLVDLGRILQAYEEIDTAALKPRRVRSFPRRALVRAHLQIRGRAHEGWLLRDHGIVDLDLRETGAGWRLSGFSPARVRRTLLLSSRAPGSGPTASGAAPGAAPDTEAGIAASAAAIPDRLLELTVLGPRGPRALLRHRGPRATLLLILPAGSTACGELCRAVSTLSEARAGVSAAVLFLGEEAPSGCRLPGYHASPEAVELLRGLRAMLPTVALINGEGETLRLTSAELGLLHLEVDLDRLLE
jgi:hypothetical protein